MTGKNNKICLITSMHSWNDDRIFERTATGLASLGFEITLIAPGDTEFVQDNVRILNIPVRSRFGKHILGPFDIRKKLRTVEADIYYFFNPNLMFLMRRMSQSGLKVMIDIHENYEARVDDLKLPQFIRKFLVRLYRRFENKMCSGITGITVVTQSMAEKLRSSGSPILVIDNVPYLKRLERVLLSDEKEGFPTIITSGIHSSARNCMNAVEALPMIVEEFPHAIMKFVGKFQPEGYENELIGRAVQLGVANNIRTEGMLPWIENFTRISKAHIGCVFYNDDLNNRVTLPNRLYEYMFCGLVILGEDFPEVKGVIEDSNCGSTVNSSDSKQIAEKIKTLLRSDELIKVFSENSRKAIIKKYNFEIALLSLEDFLNKQV